MTIAYRYCQDIDLAKDALQNAFIKIFNHIDTFDHTKGKIESWTAKITTNESLLLLRKYKRFNVVEIETDDFFKTVDMNWEKYSVEDIKSIIHKMSHTQKVILNLYFIEEYSYREISELLGIKESTARGRLSESRKILIEKYNLLNSLK